LSCKSLLEAVAAPFSLCVMCLLALAGCGGSSNNNTITTTAVNNTVALKAGFGPNGANGGLVNGIFTNINVCQHGSTNCVPIDNVLVDTGSIGLRIISSALGSVKLSQILQNNNALLECIQYGDTSYSWGPMQIGDVQIAGEQALNIPVQVIGATNLAVPSTCLTNPVNPSLPGTPPGNEDTLQSLGANGILGIGDGIFDCGSFCTKNSTGSGYFTCPNGTCAEVAVATGSQAVNPVSQFSSLDKNGVMITFPPVGTTGASTLSGTMNFGIATQSDNALGNVTLFAMDACGDFPSVTFNGVSYADTSCTSGSGTSFGAFVDTGSNALYVLDAGTLSSFGISDCPSSSNVPGFYCVTGGGTATLSGISLMGNGNVGAAAISLSIADAVTLVKTNNAVFNNLGGDSGSSPSTDFFDLGSPFFFGRTVFIGIAGETVPNGVNAPNGFVAF
jgi:Protein of unknown function (DUF3443)